MEKIYEFKVTAKMSKEHRTHAIYTFRARNASEARNMFKQSFPNHDKVIACVRGCEIKTTIPQSKAVNQNQSSGVGAIALGVAAAGGFVLSKLLGGKNKN